MPDLAPLAQLNATLGRASDPEAQVRFIIDALERDPELQRGVAAYTGRFFKNVRIWVALADVNVLPAHGLIAELRERVTAKFLPSHRPPHDLVEVLREVAPSRSASLWVERVSDECLIHLCRLLMPSDPLASGSMLQGCLRAIELLAHRLAATGEEPHVQLADEEAADYDSPFLAQAEEVTRFTACLRRQLEDSGEECDDAADEGPAHAFVLLNQCREQVRRITRRVPESGATIRLTYELERINDLIERLRMLLSTLSSDEEEAWAARASLLRQVVRARMESEEVLPVVRRALYLVASEIVSHAGRAGGHYIGRTVRDYAWMWRAAAGAGIFVGLAAVIKVGVGSLQLPIALQALLFSLNYAACFVLVQAAGFTIATKQPAMTAAALADAVEADQKDEGGHLVTTIICLVRSQTAAILGNVLVALPTTIAVSLALSPLLGGPVADEYKAAHLAHELHPTDSAAIPHAALTGVWLALSGIVAGYVSNMVIARHVPARMVRSRPLERWLGRERLARLAEWTGTRAGPFSGSVALGFLLGSTGMVGAVLGLPLEIRHVSFASANLGLSIHSLGLSGADIGWSIAGIAAVGVVNLVVSFGLSLTLAMRARGRGFRSFPALAGKLLMALVRDLPAWFIPVGRTARPVEETEPVDPDAAPVEPELESVEPEIDPEELTTRELPAGAQRVSD